MRRAACLVLVAVGSVCACGQSERGQNPGPPEGVVAGVGNQVVTWAELQAYMVEIERSFAAQKRPSPDEGTPQYANLEAQAIERLVERVQDQQAATELRVSPPEDELEREVARIDPAELEKYGVTPERLRAEITAHLLKNEIFKAVVSSVEISDANVRAAYERDIETYTHRAPREALYLWVRDEGLARELGDRIAAGEDFEALALQYADPEIGSGRRTFEDEGWATAVGQAIFSLGVGQLSQPIKAGVGWALVEPLSPLDPGNVAPLQTVADDIGLELRTRRNREVMEAWERDLKARLAPVYAEGYDPCRAPQRDPLGGSGRAAEGSRRVRSPARDVYLRGAGQARLRGRLSGSGRGRSAVPGASPRRPVHGRLHLTGARERVRDLSGGHVRLVCRRPTRGDCGNRAGRVAPGSPRGR
jgi:parvulin-like peptidyl-prolyl isomerase